MTDVLTLTIVEPQTADPEARTRTIGEGTLRIGRDPDNDWVLDDEGRLLSRHHCTVAGKAGLFTVIDTSANGVFLNDAEEPIGRGNSAIVGDQDMIQFGDYVIRATVDQQAGKKDAFRAMLPGGDAGAAQETGQRHPPTFFGGAQEPASRPARASGSQWPSSPATSSYLMDLDLPDARAPFGDLPDEGPAKIIGAQSDHLPAQEQAFRPVRPIITEIPDDWDQDADDQAAAPEIPPMDPSTRRQAPSFEPRPVDRPARTQAEELALWLIECLGRIEEEAFGDDAARLLAETPETVLARLLGDDPAETRRAIADLSQRLGERAAAGHGAAGSRGRSPSAAPPLPKLPKAGDENQ